MANQMAGRSSQSNTTKGEVNTMTQSSTAVQNQNQTKGEVVNMNNKLSFEAIKAAGGHDVITGFYVSVSAGNSKRTAAFGYSKLGGRKTYLSKVVDGQPIVEEKTKKEFLQLMEALNISVHDRSMLHSAVSKIRPIFRRNFVTCKCGSCGNGVTAAEMDYVQRNHRRLGVTAFTPICMTCQKKAAPAASAASGAPTPASTAPGVIPATAETAPQCKCEGCGKEVKSPRVQKYSAEQFGGVYCYSCQGPIKKARKAEANPEAPVTETTPSVSEGAAPSSADELKLSMQGVLGRIADTYAEVMPVAKGKRTKMTKQQMAQYVMDQMEFITGQLVAMNLVDESTLGKAEVVEETPVSEANGEAVKADYASENVVAEDVEPKIEECFICEKEDVMVYSYELNHDVCGECAAKAKVTYAGTIYEEPADPVIEESAESAVELCLSEGCTEIALPHTGLCPSCTRDVIMNTMEEEETVEEGPNAKCFSCGHPYHEINWYTPSCCPNCNRTFID